VIGPLVVVSLDFELRWGVADVLGGDFDRYRRNLEGVREAVPALLELFAELGVQATWATVAAVACDGWDELSACAPPPPRYVDRNLVHDLAAYRRADPSGRLHFAPDLVALIARTEGQELGSHTFMHAFLREPGVMQRDVHADAAAVSSLFLRRFGRSPGSFVYPRNQIAFRGVLAEHGIRVVRENADAWYWQLTGNRQESSLIRGMRLLESVAPIGRRTAPAPAQRASYFTRVNLPEPAFRLHVRRVASDAASMASGDALHLWAHPHNFGGDPRRTVARLGDLLRTVRDRRPDARFTPMGALAA